MPNINVLLIGPGEIGEMRTEALVEAGKKIGGDTHIQLAGVIGKDEESAQEFAEKHHFQSFSSWDKRDQLLNTIDKDNKLIAIIQLPHDAQHDCLNWLLDYIEKTNKRIDIFLGAPLACSMEQAQEYKRKIDTLGINFALGFHAMFTELWKKQAELLRKGNIIGDITAITIDAPFAPPKDWYKDQEKSKGPAHTHETYLMDVILKLLGTMPTNVYATAANKAHPKLQFDTYTINCAFPNDITVTINFNYSAERTWRFEFQGTNNNLIVVKPEPNGGGEIEILNEKLEKIKLYTFNDNPFVPQLETFVRAITSGQKQDLANSIDYGVMMNEIAIKTDQSAINKQIEIFDLILPESEQALSINKKVTEKVMSFLGKVVEQVPTVIKTIETLKQTNIEQPEITPQSPQPLEKRLH